MDDLFLGALKVCTECGQAKPLSDFAQRRARPVGRAASCKACRNAYAKANRSRYREYNTRKRAEHRRAKPELQKANAKRFRERHPEKVREATAKIRRWCRENPDKAAQSRKNYIARNPHLRRVWTRNRRAKVASIGGQISPELQTLLLEEQGGLCPYCDGPLLQTGYHLDHYVPIALGGANEDWNIQLLCPSCNRHKADRHPLTIKIERMLDANVREGNRSIWE